MMLCALLLGIVVAVEALAAHPQRCSVDVDAENSQLVHRMPERLVRGMVAIHECFRTGGLRGAADNSSRLWVNGVRRGRPARSVAAQRAGEPGYPLDPDSA